MGLCRYRRKLLLRRCGWVKSDIFSRGCGGPSGDRRSIWVGQYSAGGVYCCASDGGGVIRQFRGHATCVSPKLTAFLCTLPTAREFGG